MRAADQFHTGIVVDDLEGTLAQLTALFGYEWAPEIGGPTSVVLPTGPAEPELRFAYSRTVPRLEVIRSVPGHPIWQPSTSGIHHLGYWSDDVAADSAALVARGYALEVTGARPDGTPYWAYHRPAHGPRIELVSREVQSGLERLWSS
ncbi:VOC family protein [Cryptosporangium minutisporangium]|uniref:VOC family protein n=1 Tax=Cryptosporangium minutisporangium TaxID=113569 RepID=A0ABP6SU71_9ACTN